MAEYRAGEFATIPNIPSLAEITPHELTVFVYLCWRAGKDKSCFPSYSSIEKETGVSRRTAVNAISALEEKGWIKRMPRERGNGSHASNVYKILQVKPAKRTQKGSAADTPHGAGKDTGGSAGKDTPLTITNKNNNHLTTTNVVEPKAHGNEEINLIVKSFEETFGIKQPGKERRAAQWLRSKGDTSTLTALFEATAKAQASDKYCPRTPTLTKFYYKLPELQDYFQRKRQNSSITEINY